MKKDPQAIAREVEEWEGREVKSFLAKAKEKEIMTV